MNQSKGGTYDRWLNRSFKANKDVYAKKKSIFKGKFCRETAYCNSGVTYMIKIWINHFSAEMHMSEKNQPYHLVISLLFCSVFHLIVWDLRLKIGLPAS